MDGPFNTLGAYTQALGIELELLAGTPVTVLVGNFASTDTDLQVQSTLGFPPFGYLRIAGLLVYYGAKTPTRFQELQYSHLVTIPDRSYVHSATRKQLPDSYEHFWIMPWFGNDNGVELEE